MLGYFGFSLAIDIENELHYGTSFAPRSENNLYAPPPDLENFIGDMSTSLVQISCQYGELVDKGTGFAIDLSSSVALDANYETHVVSNSHVVEKCLASDGTVSMKAGPDYELNVQSQLIDIDADNDLVLFEISVGMPALKIAEYFSNPGEWNMVIGNPASWTGKMLSNATTFGHTVAVETKQLNYTSAIINSGNSGGPLINSRGELIGITSYAVASTEDGVHNVALDAELLCKKIISCKESED
jgi:S1-C subfamily serine protease